MVQNVTSASGLKFKETFKEEQNIDFHFMVSKKNYLSCKVDTILHEMLQFLESNLKTYLDHC